MYSHDQEIQVGQQAVAEVRRQMPVLPEDDPLTRYVRMLGQRLVPYVPNTPQNPRFPYQFYVVNLKDVNAFALPGGPIFINVGTIQAADNEAQLVGVMAHEMSHVYERHGTSQATKEAYAQVPLGVLGAILGNGIGGQLARLGVGSLVGGVFLHYSRSAEAEADHVGALLMYLAGYNPQALADFFRKLEQEGGGGRGPQFLSDHPNPGNRAVAIARLIQSLPPRPLNQDTGQFPQIHQIAMGRQALTNQQVAARQRQGPQGQSSGSTIGTPSREDVLPRGGFQTLNHSAFRIDYPANWEIISGDQTSDVTIAPRAGIANNAVAYGVIIRAFQPGSQSLDGALHELEHTIQQSNPELRIVGHDEPITINGIQGRSVDMIGPSPIRGSDGRAERERDWLIALPWRQGEVVYMVFISPDSDFDRLRPTFEQMLRSFRLQG